MSNQVHASASTYLIKTHAIGRDCCKKNIANFNRQFLEIISPCRDSLVSCAHKVVHKHYGIVGPESFAQNVASSNKKWPELRSR